ncbi:unnamed protein product, partial [Trichobilharzia regenti]
MLCFWWVIVVYSMAMLLCIYTFQFNDSPSFWQHKLGLSSEILPQVSRGSVHSRSGVSDDHNSATSVSPSSNLSNFIEDVNSAFQIVVSKLYCWAVSLTNHCWRFLEIHWIKVVGLVIILTCINEYGNTTAWDPTAWIGLKKVANCGQYIMPYGALMVVTVVWHAITYRQRQFYNNDRIKRPDEGIVFPGVTINSMGYDLLNVVKFAFNYGFYKFGLELCHCVTVVTACSRVDAFSVLYLMLMLVFLFTPRRLCARLWTSYMVILAALIPIQYALCVGLPPGLCLNYPWYTDSVEINNLLQWLYLPNEFGAPSAHKLTADFFQFVAVALQYRVFKVEQRPDAEVHGGGSNRPILSDELPKEGDRDFVSTKESYLDYLRHLIFYWSYWVSLAVVLVTGVVWITLFCLGYMIISFIYLWMGLNVMLRKRTNLINSWNVIIGYNFCVILAKCSLQLMGCVYWSRMAERCWLIQLFGVQCMNPMSWNHFNLPLGHETSCAAVSSGLHWDVICFIFIIFQRKVFTSHSFSHVFLDLQVQSQFASRGAYLINRKLMLAIYEQAMEEQFNLAKVQEKINRIQQRQEAFGRSNANVTEHYIMLRSGDYYLFEGDPEEDDNFVIRETHTSTHDSDHSERNDSPPPPMTRLRESISNFKLPKLSVGADNERQSVKSNIPTINNRPSKSQVTLVPRGKNYLRDVWPSADPNVASILSNYTDPYSTIRKERHQEARPSSHGRIAFESESHQEQPLFTDAPRDLTHPGPILGHRRMRSHPEFLRRQFVGHQKNTSPSPFNEQLIHRTNERRDQSGHSRHRPYETHRRLFSASEAISPSKDRPSSPEKFTLVQNTNRNHRRPTKLSLSRSSPPKVRGSSATPSTSHIQSPPRITKASDVNLGIDGNSEKVLTVTDSGENPVDVVIGTPQPHDPLSNGQNNFSYPYFDDGQEADRDSDDEEDDANPPSTPNTRLNPIQLLNRAMELGALSAVKQYRRSLHAHSQGLRQREQVDMCQSRIPPSGKDSTVAGVLPSSSSMQHVNEYTLDHESLKDARQLTPYELVKRSCYPPSKSGLKKLSVPDIYYGLKPTGVHFSRKLLKQPNSPQVDEEADPNEHFYVVTSEDNPSKPLIPGTSHLKSRKDHHNESIPLLALKSGRNRPGYRTSENTRRKWDSTQKLHSSVGNSSKQTTDFEPAGILSQTRDNPDTKHFNDDNDFVLFIYIDSSLCTLYIALIYLSELSHYWIKSARDTPYPFQPSYVNTSRNGFDFIPLNNYESAVVQLAAAVLDIISTTPERHLPLSNRQFDISDPQNSKHLSRTSDSLMRSHSLENIDHQDHEREKAFRQSRSYAFLLLIAVGNLAIVVIVIKYIFQFRFFHFNDATLRPTESSEPLWLPRILGLDKNDDYAVFDLVQLISLFLHRGYLKDNGLWRDHTEFTQDLELIVKENKAVQLSHSKQGISSLRTTPGPYFNKPQIDFDVDDAIPTGTTTGCIQPYAQPSCHTIPFGKTWNPLLKLRRFYLKMTDPRYNKKVDVYIYMFLCEFIAFWIMILGYVSFGPSTGMGDNALEFLKSNRKQVLGKFIFQIIHVVLIHGWLFFILPHITRTYLLIPFLYELRNVMDWMWTSSALSLYHWMELEDVYSKIFILKCWRRSELAYPTPRGQNRDTSKKALTGGLLLAFFFICFWGPMALTSFIGATFDVNPPVLCSFSFSFGGFPPTFEFTSREGNIFTVNSSELSNFIRCHEKDKQTFGFLHNFEWNDLRYVTIDGFSGNIWAITPPSYQALMKKLSSPDSDLLLHFHMKCR